MSRAHDDTDRSITSWGNHGTVGWDDDDSKFTFDGDKATGRGKFKGERVDYCNGLIDDGNNSGAYPPFNGVRDMCKQFFLDVEQARPSSGGLLESCGSPCKAVTQYMMKEADN